MKRMLLRFMFCIIILGMLMGCSSNKEMDKYSDFEHYSAKDLARMMHVGGYVVALLKQQTESGFATVLLYPVGEDDYVLIDQISISEISFNESHMRFYNNKLYVIKATTPVVMEYTLDKENIQVRDLMFDLHPIVNAETISVWYSSINDVNDDYIFLRGSFNSYNGNVPFESRNNVNMKCSLENYECFEV